MITLMCSFLSSQAQLIYDESENISTNNRHRLESELPIVTLKNGARVLGTYENSPEKKPTYFFKTIRYGEVPVRFGLPQMAKPWNDIYDATHYRNGCPQSLPFISYNEDCLYLNVWQPVNSSHHLKPVIVYFYGGGFEFGDINYFYTQLIDGSNFIDFGDLVFVSVQYRLGAFGFLYTGTERAPGNQGVHDMLLSLRWVKENIERFGGDPNNVIVYGESSGSIAISAMIISPLANGLFQRAIMSSGAINEFYAYSPENLLNYSKEVAKKCECPVDNLNHMVDCMQNKSASELANLRFSANIPAIMKAQMFPMMYGDKEGLLPERPSTMLKKGIYNSVDLISGFNYGEYGTIGLLINPELINGFKNYNIKDVKRLINNSIDSIKGISKYEDLKQKILDFYTKDMNENSSTAEVRRTIINLLSDGSIICPTYLFTQKYARALARNSSNRNQVFSYRFDHHSFYMNLLACLSWMGPCHGMELPIMLGLAVHPRYLSLFFTNEDERLSEKTMRTITHFAKNGEPGQYMDGKEWPKFMSIDSETGKNTNKIGKSIVWKQMVINSEHHLIITNEYVDHCRFWEPILFADDPIN